MDRKIKGEDLGRSYDLQTAVQQPNHNLELARLQEQLRLAHAEIDRLKEDTNITAFPPSTFDTAHATKKLAVPSLAEVKVKKKISDDEDLSTAWAPGGTASSRFPVRRINRISLASDFGRTKLCQTESFSAPRTSHHAPNYSSDMNISIPTTSKDSTARTIMKRQKLEEQEEVSAPGPTKLVSSFVYPPSAPTLHLQAEGDLPPQAEAEDHPTTDLVAKYLRATQPLTIRSPASNARFSRPNFLNPRFGGQEQHWSTVFTAAPCAGRRIMFPTIGMHPHMPSHPGQPGLLFTLSLEVTIPVGNAGPISVFSRKYNKRQGMVWRYLGEYVHEAVRKLKPEQYAVQSPQFHEKWAHNILNSNKAPLPFRLVRAKIALRKFNVPTTAAAINAEVKQKRKKIPLTADEVSRAFERGEQYLNIVRMRCVSYDHEFVRMLAAEEAVWMDSDGLQDTKEPEAQAQTPVSGRQLRNEDRVQKPSEVNSRPSPERKRKSLENGIQHTNDETIHAEQGMAGITTPRTAGDFNYAGREQGGDTRMKHGVYFHGGTCPGAISANGDEGDLDEPSSMSVKTLPMTINEMMSSPSVASARSGAQGPSTAIKDETEDAKAVHAPNTSVNESSSDGFTTDSEHDDGSNDFMDSDDEVESEHNTDTREELMDSDGDNSRFLGRRRRIVRRARRNGGSPSWLRETS
ncbi:hypothetical protein B0H16DRAFT_1741669 [Mycena metata]|uniref:DUF6697 domain-containing protein n=1 Tax=Mycena metata TaxID=1033252 RepID=A0AAD7HAA1_9AGAR|nr:hypothetical protein B0H16DRAFT_1741669 [Mycena metata]